MTLHRPILFALMIALVPAMAAAQKTTYDFDKTATFSTYKTYSFKAGTPAVQPLIDQRIVAALENELKAKGFTKKKENPLKRLIKAMSSFATRTSNTGTAHLRQAQ